MLPRRAPKTMLTLTPVYGIEVQSPAGHHPSWLPADSGNVFKTESKEVAEAAIDKMKDEGCCAGLTVERYDLFLVSKEALHARLAALHKAAQRVVDADPWDFPKAIDALQSELDRTT